MSGRCERRTDLPNRFPMRLLTRMVRCDIKALSRHGTQHCGREGLTVDLPRESPYAPPSSVINRVSPAGPCFVMVHPDLLPFQAPTRFMHGQQQR